MVSLTDTAASGDGTSRMGTLNVNGQLSAGRPWPLGAQADRAGVNFALFSAHAERVELCIFDGERLHTLPMPQCTDQVWHGHLSGATSGLRYAYRVYGPQEPNHRFDPQRLLLDPYARELSGQFSYEQHPGTVNGLWSCVNDEVYDWGDDQPPSIPLADSILYEVHVKGATRLHPDVPEALRGTYAGLASPAMLKHFRQLGITAVNLLPVHYFLDERHLVAGGRSNYWGYNTLAFFAPEPAYAARLNGQSVISEFRSMVRSLHAAGLEVILDVVFNHTAESDENGPTISFRGIDNASYYRLQADNPALYENYSGCGNTFNLAHPRVLQLVMDSLRYWVGEMHVDGFRFDLAATLTRNSDFLAAVRQDPLLSRVKLIAEPWDLGMDGYRLGRFPLGWSEWNDRFRDDVRAFWLTDGAGIGTLAQRLAGSSEIFQHNSRAPQAGINFVTAHDGFTLLDLVSYQDKHNELNGEENRDGHSHNLSWNCGEEGASGNPVVLRRRHLLQRALLATLFVAQGVPMLQGGDELGRTQSGNNNAYCQDNPMTWFNWANADHELCEFTAGLIALRQRFPQLKRRNWLQGKSDDAQTSPDVVWWHPDAYEITGDDWDAQQDALGLILAPPAGMTHPQTLLILINRRSQSIEFRLPSGNWQRCCDTGADTPFLTQNCRGSTLLNGRSVQLLTQE